MTHVELVEKILDDFKKDFARKPAEDSEYFTKRDIEFFEKGIIYAYQYLLMVLKNGDE